MFSFIIGLQGTGIPECKGKKYFVMSTLFEGLTESEIEYLKYIHKRKYFDGFEMYLNMDSSSDYRIKKFVDNGYIIMSISPKYSGRYEVKITEKGIAALVDYTKFTEKNHRHSKIEWKKFYLGIFISIISILVGILLAKT